MSSDDDSWRTTHGAVVVHGDRVTNGPETIGTREVQRRGHGRRTLLDASLRAIVDGGLGAVTVRAVTDRAQLSLGSVSYHFPSRIDMLIAACATRPTP